MSKQVNRLYSVDIAQSTINILNEVISTGKNASVLIQIANNMKGNKQLPKWANAAFSTEHFERLLTLKSKDLRSVCKNDSYDFLRTVINLHLKNETISEEQFLKLNKVLTVKAFNENEFLQQIKTKYINAVNDVSEPDNISGETGEVLKAKGKDTDSVSDTVSDSDSDTDTDSVKTQILKLISGLNIDDAIAIRQILDEQIDAQLTAELKKAG